MNGMKGEERIKKKYVERVRGAALEGVTRRIHENPKHPFSSGADNDGPTDRTGPHNGESGAPVAMAAAPRSRSKINFAFVGDRPRATSAWKKVGGSGESALRIGRFSRAGSITMTDWRSLYSDNCRVPRTTIARNILERRPGADFMR